MRIALSALTLPIICINAHSFVQKLNDGIQRGGNAGKSDFDLQRYFCPDGLANCKNDERNHIYQNEENLKPCRAGESPEWGTLEVGGDLDVTWVSRGHDNSQSDGTCVRILIAPFGVNDYSKFQSIISCAPYVNSKGDTQTTAKLPSNIKAGKYTVLWLWDFAGFMFSSCVDVNVGGSAGSSDSTSETTVETASPVEETTTPKPEEPKTTAAPEEESTKKSDEEDDDETDEVKLDDKGHIIYKITKADKKLYKKKGCNAISNPDAFCQHYKGGKSHCKHNKDDCKRSICQGDKYRKLSKCKARRLV